MTMLMISPQRVKNVVNDGPHGWLTCAKLYLNALVLFTPIKTHVRTTQPKCAL